MKSIVLAGYFVNWLVCPTNATPTEDYRWVLELKPGTQTEIKAKVGSEVIPCIWITSNKKDRGQDS